MVLVGFVVPKIASTLTLFICTSEALEASRTTVFAKSESRYARITVRLVVAFRGPGSALNILRRWPQRFGRSTLHFAPEFRRNVGSLLAKLSPVRPQLLQECRFSPCKRGVDKIVLRSEPMTYPGTLQSRFIGLGQALTPIVCGLSSRHPGCGQTRRTCLSSSWAMMCKAFSVSDSCRDLCKTTRTEAFAGAETPGSDEQTMSP